MFDGAGFRSLLDEKGICEAMAESGIEFEVECETRRALHCLGTKEGGASMCRKYLRVLGQRR